ncbi:MAG: CAP domain-containing protein [Aureispira sp.]
MRVSIFLCSVLLLLLNATSCSEKATLDAPDEVKPATILQLVNEARTTGCTCGNTSYPPVPALNWNTLLESTAQAHSEDMRAVNTLSHQGSNGSDAGSRLTQAGYIWQTYGENIAEGYTSEAAVVKGWLESEGHCKNIMKETFTEMGVATSGSYWTQVFGTPR